MPTKSVINLLPESAVVGSRRLSLFKTLQAILIVAAMACLILTIGIWALGLVAGRQVVAENQKAKDLEEKIKSNSKKEQQFYLLSSQLSKADDLLNSRVSLEKLLNQAIVVFPDDAVLTSAQIDGSGRTISIKYQANSFDIMARIVAAAKAKPFSSVKVNAFSRELSGKYFIDLTVELL